MPRRAERVVNVEECILLPSGKTSTIMIDQKYAPYEKQSARIENLCGSFKTLMSTTGLSRVMYRTQASFGRQHEIYHLQGNVSINQNKASFMGVRSMRGLTMLSRSLRLETPTNVVHMAVICIKMGKRMQVSPQGLIESMVSKWVEHVQVEARMLEYNNTLRFSIVQFAKQFEFPEKFRPDNNDWSVTGKGTVLARLTWRKAEWSEELEDACLDLCNRTADWLDRF
jgi:hypothetical protein